MLTLSGAIEGFSHKQVFWYFAEQWEWKWCWSL